MSSPEIRPHQIAESVLSELDHFQVEFHPSGGPHTLESQHRLKSEPCVGYAEATGADGSAIEYFICRTYTPADYSPSRRSILYASYLSPAGRIVAKQPGEIHSFEVRHRTGLVLAEHSFALNAKAEFRPAKSDGKWDCQDAQVAWIRGRLAIRSFRNLLSGVAEAAAVRLRRFSVQLPDQAILDETQDEIFRLPITQKVRISGAPGTGKTTVLLKRLSQKTKKDFLTEHERKNLDENAWRDGQNWILFTPSDLLKSYLKEAMAKELLPASDDHVKVYRTFRLELLRDIGFVRVGQHGFFKQSPGNTQLLKRATGSEHTLLNKAFADHLATTFSRVFAEALQEFNNETRALLANLTDAAESVLAKALDIFAKVPDDPIELREAQRRTSSYRLLHEELKRFVATLRSIGDLHGRPGDTPVVEIYQNTRRWIEWAANQTVGETGTALFPEIPPLVAALRERVRALTEGLSLGRLLQTIPRSFQDFREESPNCGRYFDNSAEKPIRNREISEAEQDVLAFHALEFAQKLWGHVPKDFRGVPDELRALFSRFRLLIAVDEATDFSPLELACMERLALPQGGVTICGDLMQRVTTTGMKKWEEMEEACGRFHACDLKVSYRQTETLFRIGHDLFAHAMSSAPNFRSAYPSRPEDPPPLAFKGTQEQSTATWLVERVCEIFGLCNQHLPTTAILVPTPAEVDSLRNMLLPLLHENGLEVEAFHGGQTLGDAARVRIFPVEHIKGLEFEAVFYVGLDRMAEIHQSLIDKYLYVGLSRARSFLGITFDRQFPNRLKCIEHHFQLGGTWSVEVPAAPCG